MFDRGVEKEARMEDVEIHEDDCAMIDAVVLDTVTDRLLAELPKLAPGGDKLEREEMGRVTRYPGSYVREQDRGQCWRRVREHV